MARVAEAMGVTARTLERLNERFVEDSLRASLQRKQRDRPAREVLFDGALKARLVALACAEALEGRRRWAVGLLADKAVELGFAPTVSHMTASRIL